MSDAVATSNVQFHMMKSIRRHEPKPAPPEDPIAGIESNELWRNAWLMSIALAWSDPGMQRKLVANPRQFFREECGYELPMGLTVIVRPMAEKDPGGRPTGWNAEERMWYLENTEVVMVLPPAPTVEQQAIALSAYEATGRTYPFTCC